jgi:hypothetical protein
MSTFDKIGSFGTKIVTNESVKKEIADRIRTRETLSTCYEYLYFRNGKFIRRENMTFKSNYIPILTYLAEPWTWTKADISRLQGRSPTEATRLPFN